MGPGWRSGAVEDAVDVVGSFDDLEDAHLAAALATEGDGDGEHAGEELGPPEAARARRGFGVKEAAMEVWDHAPVARMVKRHLGGIVLAAKVSITNASAEALNSVVQMLKHVAHGYRNRERFRNAIYFHLGDGQRLWQLDGPSREPSPHRALHDAGPMGQPELALPGSDGPTRGTLELCTRHALQGRASELDPPRRRFARPPVRARAPDARVMAIHHTCHHSVRSRVETASRKFNPQVV